MKKSNRDFLVQLLIVIIALLVIGWGTYLYLQNRYHNLVLESVGKNQTSATSTAPIPGWLTYTDPVSGASIQYPPSFNTQYASLDPNVPDLNEITNVHQIDSKGCYLDQKNGNPPGKEQEVTINNKQFCLSVTGDVGAGQLYSTYTYTTDAYTGNYYFVSYTVHTSNSCSAYMNDPDVNAPDNLRYRECLDTEKNYDSLVMKPIEQSVGTLTIASSTVSKIGKCGLQITSIEPNATISFPLTIKGLVDNTNSSKLGCSWTMFEGQAGTAKLFYRLSNNWIPLQDISPDKPGIIIVDDWTSLKTNFSVTLHPDIIDSAVTDSNPALSLKIVFTAENPSGDPSREMTFELPVVLKK